MRNATPSLAAVLSFAILSSLSTAARAERTPPPGLETMAGSIEIESLVRSIDAFSRPSTASETLAALDDVLDSLHALEQGFGRQAAFPRAGYDRIEAALESLRESIAADVQEASTGAFLRGDSNGDGNVDLSDSIHLLSFLFGDGEPASCLEAADFNASGSIDISDAIYLLGFHYLGGPSPAAPFPSCGTAAVDTGLTCESSSCVPERRVYRATSSRRTKISFTCDGNNCVCTGDPDCNEMFSAGICRDGNAVCGNFDGVVICICVQK